MRSATSTGGIAERAGLRAGQHVLEIGTGWGGFALYAAGELGCRVTTITISQEQHDLARERVHAAGPRPTGRRPAARLPRHRGHVRRHRLDRDARGGRRRVPTRRSSRRAIAALRPGGRLSLQVDHVPGCRLRATARGANWIQTYIFPGGLCPSLAVIERATRDTALLIGGVTDIAADYVRTLRRVADGVPRQARRGPRARVRRAVHPDVGLLPGLERGGLRDRPQPGPPDLDGEGARAAARIGVALTRRHAFQRLSRPSRRASRKAANP